ncbi:hypothetical protein SBD_0709 [Streptomyces bottropensis ATCC 25435]|uniref:Uncharacterized protein n=1 Tax=Streptomyces bottropensis ATCC 25435 TaxID=1054862 RepID=M3DM60_9ACTN|nr:hypothetical protein SBD_0709 [Streptomyces bottropensis ATCC 25435]
MGRRGAGGDRPGRGIFPCVGHEWNLPRIRRAAHARGPAVTPRNPRSPPERSSEDRVPTGIGTPTRGYSTRTGPGSGWTLECGRGVPADETRTRLP